MISDHTETKSTKTSAKFTDDSPTSECSLKILLVEDDEIDQLTFEHYVEHEDINYEYEIACDVAEALKIMKSKAFDVIVVDYLLPDGTAFDVLRASTNTPVIFITGAGNEEVAVKAIKSGAYDYVIKDSTNNHLKVLPITIEKAVERHTAIEHKQILEKQLSDSEKNAYVGSIAEGIANDINTMLGSIIGFSQLAMEDKDNHQELEKDINEVLCACKKASYLVQEILSLSNRNKTIEAFSKPIFLAPIVDKVIERLRPFMPNNIEVTRRFRERAGTLSANTEKAYQIIHNLCDNAILAMKKHGGTLTISTTELERSALPAAVASELLTEHYTRLTIKDTGIGMTQEVQKRIFEPFFTTRSMDATGFGLVVVNRLAIEAGGTITVSSEPKMGTIIDVYLPYRNKIIDPPARDFLLAGMNNETLQDKHLCIVQGDRQIEHLIQRAFAALPCKITTISNSCEVLKHFSQKDKCEFDMVVLDDTLDNVNSEVLAKRISSLNSQIPIVVWCNYLKGLPEYSVRKIGSRYYLDKPIEIVKLLKTLTIINGSLIGL